jgi:hypothetical protein
MKIVIVTGAADNGPMARWLQENDVADRVVERWIIDPMPAVVEQVLASLVAQWQLMPADMLLFPPGAWGGYSAFSTASPHAGA